MGRMILTNNDNWCKRLQENYESLLELPMSGEYDGSFHLRVYAKKRVKNENFYKNDKGIIVTNGTVFYKGLMNQEALKKLLSDFTSLLKENEAGECIRKVRKNLFGNYCVVLLLSEYAIGFVDETSMYPFYYYTGKEGYVLTNTFYNINECCNTSPNELAAMEYSLCTSIVGNETPYIDVYRLLEDNYFFLDFKSNQIEIKKTEPNYYTYKFNNYEEATDLIKEEIEDIARVRSKYLKHTLLFTTGGIDSRMELALHNHFNDSMIVGYWAGDDVITNATNQDLNISQKLAEISEAPFIFYDVSEDFSECLKNLSEEQLSKFGEYACIYSHNRKWLDIPNLASEDAIESIAFGSLDEIIRELPQVDQAWNDAFGLNDLVSEVKMRTGVFNTVICCDGLTEYITNKIKKSFGDIREPLSIEDSVNLFNRGRLHSNTIVDAYINLYYYDFNICGQKRIVDLIDSIPYEWRRESKIAISLTKQWDADLMNIPYYSHHHTVLYDSNANRVVETNKRRIELVLRRILKQTFLYKPLVSVGHKFRKKLNGRASANKAILQECIEILRKSSFIKDSDVKINSIQDDVGFDLASLARIVAEIRLIDISKRKI